MTGWAIRVTTPPLTQPGEPLTELFVIAEPDMEAAAVKISELAGGGTDVIIVAPVSAKAIKLFGLQPGQHFNITD
jgi:hypothetical protein